MPDAVRTDVDDVVMAARGILLNVSKGNPYEIKRAKAIADMHKEERINKLEDRLNNIENLLQRILEKKDN